MNNYSKHSAEATARLYAPAESFNVGDFIYARIAAGKERDINDFIEIAKRHGTNYRLCKIVEIVEVSNGYDLTHNWLSEELADMVTNPGGCRTEDAPDKKQWEYTKDGIETFYALATILRAPNGKYIVVDKEGYTYCRYVGLPVNYGDIFAAEVQQAMAEIAAAENARIAEEKRAAQQRENEINARIEQIKAKYPQLRVIQNKHQKYGRAVRSNFIKWLKINFPEVECKVGMWETDCCPYKYTATVNVMGDKQTEVKIQELFYSEWCELCHNVRVFGSVFGYIYAASFYAQ